MQHTIRANNDGTKYKTLLSNNKTSIFSDETVTLGGLETGFTPTELLCSSLAACTAITLRMYSDHKVWNVGVIDVSVTYIAASGENSGYFQRNVSFSAKVDSDALERLKNVAEKCPLHKILSAGHEIKSQIL